MTERITIEHNFIKPRDLQTIIKNIEQGGVTVIPSDSGYNLVCRLGDKGASQKIRQLKGLEKNHPFTVLSSDLTHLGKFARVDNAQYRFLKKIFPGAFTCILPASKEVPRLVQHEKRKTIGIRIPDDKICQTIIQENVEALMGVSLFDGEEIAGNLDELDKSIANNIDVIIDVGEKIIRPTTIIDMTTMPAEVVRQGAGVFDF